MSSTHFSLVNETDWDLKQKSDSQKEEIEDAELYNMMR